MARGLFEQEVRSSTVQHTARERSAGQTAQPVALQQTSMLEVLQGGSTTTTIRLVFQRHE